MPRRRLQRIPPGDPRLFKVTLIPSESVSERKSWEEEASLDLLAEIILLGQSEVSTPKREGIDHEGP
jgi:hypothetical protein